MRKRSFLAAMASAPLAPLLNACGGSNNDNSDVNLRFVNASAGYPSLNFFLDGTEVATALASGGAASPFIGTGAGTHAVSLRSTAAGTTLLSASINYTGGSNNTVLAYGDVGSLAIIRVQENAAAPSSGSAKLRVSSTYLTGQATPTVTTYIVAQGGTNIEATALPDGTSTYTEEGAGTYRIFVTAAGDASRTALLDWPDIVLNDQDIATLVLTPSNGAVLPNAVLSLQGGAVTTKTNPYARVRLVAGTATGSKVVAMLNGTTKLSSGDGTIASNAEQYVLVPTGTSSLSVTVDGGTAVTQSLTLSAGEDVTVLVYGNAETRVAVLVDDNTLPASNYASFRFVHASYESADKALSLYLNTSTQVASSITFGNASTYTSSLVSTNTSNQNQVTVSASAADVRYTQSNVQFSSGTSGTLGSVYTIFLLGSDVGLIVHDN